MTTFTQSLSERLREFADDWSDEWPDMAILNEEAADTLDRQAAEIELMKEGRQLHDELADHLEHELAQQSALLAQAAAALKYLLDRVPVPADDEPPWHIEAREALAAIRAKEHP